MPVLNYQGVKTMIMAFCSGSTSSSLVVITVEESDEGTFRCAIANGAGNVTSAEATLTVGKSVGPPVHDNRSLYAIY